MRGILAKLATSHDRLLLQPNVRKRRRQLPLMRPQRLCGKRWLAIQGKLSGGLHKLSDSPWAEKYYSEPRGRFLSRERQFAPGCSLTIWPSDSLRIQSRSSTICRLFGHNSHLTGIVLRSPSKLFAPPFLTNWGCRQLRSLLPLSIPSMYAALRF